MIFKFLFLEIYHLFNKELHKLEYDPKTQYNFHRAAALVWLTTMVGAPFWPYIWSHSIGILIVLEVSLYANFATEFGSMSAALAAMGQNGPLVVSQGTPGTITKEVKLNT